MMDNMKDTLVDKRQAAIFDVDGTLVDVTSIRHHVMGTPKRFDLFHGGAIDCPANAPVVDLLRLCRESGLAIIIVTARNEQWLYHTLLWLEENGIEHDEIFMRGHKDQRPDYEVKSDILRKIEQRFNVRLAVDDNPSVIRLWEERGIQTVVVPGWVDSFE
jgi:Zn ribbon nucleic-acid-binding protein